MFYDCTNKESNLTHLKQLFKELKAEKQVGKIKSLSVYECDIVLLQLISQVCSQSLERLTIVKWWQPTNKYNEENDLELKSENMSELRLCLCGDPPLLPNQIAPKIKQEKFN